MFYRPIEGHGLPHNPFNAIVTPRPIGWISTRGENGRDNLAPYSFFNAVAYKPPQVMFASTETKLDRAIGKDSLANIVDTGVFCVNVVSHALTQAMNITSSAYGADVDEFEKAALEKIECETIPCARVAAAPAALECRLTQVVKLAGENNHVAFGEVVGVYMRDECIVEGRFNIQTFTPLTRLGYRDYSTITEIFSLKRPGE